MTLNPGELLLYESARLPHGRTSFLRQVCTWYNFGLQCLFFIYGLGLLVTPFLCQWFVEPKDKTGLNPYHKKYLFLSEGRASPIYLCIFVQRQVGFQCICNWKKNSLLPRLGSGGLEACACQSYLQLMQFTSMCERIFCFVKRILAVMFTQSCIKST